jgi:N-acetylmuramoyl-L-alanine amidase
MKFIAFIDAGHGSVEWNNKHTEKGFKYHCLADGKLFVHKDYTFYEGEWNRRVTARVEQKLDRLQIPYIRTYHDYLDWPLSHRRDRVQFYLDAGYKGLLISTHANASPQHNARGWEVWTMHGQDKSDRVAEILHGRTVTLLQNDVYRYRTDTWSDGDVDKEANFGILRNACPSILIEHGFFDEPNDAELLRDPGIVERFAEAQVQTIIQYKNSIQ